LFHGIYDQKIYPNKTNKIILSFFIIIGISAVVFTGISKLNDSNITEKEIVLKKDKSPKKQKKVETKKPEKKEEKKIVKKPEIKPKKITNQKN
jgi:ATP/ADP translocase